MNLLNCEYIGISNINHLFTAILSHKIDIDSFVSRGDTTNIVNESLTTKSVMPFTEIPMPELFGHSSPELAEPLLERKSVVLRFKIMSFRNTSESCADNIKLNFVSLMTLQEKNFTRHRTCYLSGKNYE